MRRKVGVASVRKKRESDAFKSVGKQMEAQKLSAVMETMSAFKESLTEFAVKHRDRINKDPEFRMQFHSMCVSVGVDPLASSKGFWADMLGVGDFYFELGVKVVQISLETRASNGGMMPIEDLLRRLRESRASIDEPISVDDVHRSVEKLSVLGGGFRVINISGKEFVLSVPLEVNNDHEEIIAEAQRMGYFTEEIFVEMQGWSRERFHMVLTPLLHEGIVWVDKHNGETSYMCPSTMSL